MTDAPVAVLSDRPDGVMLIADASEVASLRDRVARLEKFVAIVWPLVQATAPRATALATRLLREGK